MSLQHKLAYPDSTWLQVTYFIFAGSRSAKLVTAAAAGPGERTAPEELLPATPARQPQDKAAVLAASTTPCQGCSPASLWTQSEGSAHEAVPSSLRGVNGVCEHRQADGLPGPFTLSVAEHHRAGTAQRPSWTALGFPSCAASLTRAAGFAGTAWRWRGEAGVPEP